MHVSFILYKYCIYYINISYTHRFFRQNLRYCFFICLYKVSTDDKFLRIDERGSYSHCNVSTNLEFELNISKIF